MLSQEQVKHALSLKDFDTFWEEVAGLHIQICHDSECGMFFLVMDEQMNVFKDMSTFLPYLWVAAANARLWPRDGRGSIVYYTQVQIEKHGDKYINGSQFTYDNREGFKKDIRCISDMMFNKKGKE